MKKILIVGAGEFQLPGILEAKKQGYYTIATDGNPNAIGKKFADEFFHIDVTDIEGNYQLAIEKKIDGVCSIASEVSVETVAFISEKLNLVGNAYKIAKLSHNKEEYYRLFSTKGLPIPKTYVYGQDNLDLINSEYVITKPSKGSGSRLVKKLKLQELQEFVTVNQDKHHADESILVQEYIKGKELTVDGFVYKGQTYILAISEEKRNPEICENVSYELEFPPQFINKIKDQILGLSKQIATEIGIQYGPFHLELLINSNDELYLIDFSLRGGGFKLFTDIIKRTSGIDVLKEYILSVMGNEISLNQPSKFDPVILKFLYSDRSGVIKEIKNNNPFNIGEDYMVGILVDLNEKVQRPSCGRDRLAYIISWGGDIQAVKEKIKEIESMIEFTII